jgi:hypothetical protein
MATRTGLAPSDRAYEGAFKTVIVYRNTNNLNNRFIKIEAVDQRNGPIAIAGFPMNYNDMSGKSSKYLYNNGTRTISINGTDTSVRDWVWISWEMVSNFWHVGMLVNQNTPNSSIVGQNPWEPWPGDWQNHNFRRYGNHGLRVGNQ